MLILVAGGIISLLALASLSLDVNLWYTTQARLEHMTRAAAAAGFRRLEDLDFNYRNPATKRSVDQTIREYLELNGASAEEAASAVITVSKLNEITVQLNSVTGSYLAVMAGVDRIRLAGQGTLQHTNNIAPFAIPPVFLDPDRNLVANFDPKSGRLEDSVPYEVGRPYVIKYGKPVFSNYDDFVFIPMDSREHRIPAEAFAKIKTPTATPGKFVRYEQDGFLPRQHLDPSAAYQVGVFRAYGMAYAVLGLGEVDGETATLNWMLGLAGGSFLVKRKFLEKAGYRFQDRGDGIGVMLDEAGATTNTVAMLLRLSDRGGRHYTRDFALFRYLAEELPELTFPGTETPMVRVLVLSEQPQVLTITGSADPVTRVMDFARIPYVAVSDQWNPRLNLDPNSSCVASYRIQDEFPKAFESPENFRGMLESTPNANAYLERQGRLRLGDKPPPLRRRGFDWVHIHHEDFTEAGHFPTEKLAMVLGLRDFVRRGHHHLFAACLAIESLEIFLAANSFGQNPTGLFKELLDYRATLAFRDFELDDSRGGAIDLGRYASSSIDGEISEMKHQDKARYFLTDYQNPRCQNHDGLGGVYLDLSRYPPRLTEATSDAKRRMAAPEGATNTMLRDYIKPYQIPEHDGSEIESPERPCMILGAVGDPSRGQGEAWQGKNVRYLTGVADDDNDLENGHGQFTFLGGHRPSDEGGFTRVGNLIEGMYYDDNDVWVPEVLHPTPQTELRLDFDGDGSSESFLEIVKLGKAEASPLSLSPRADGRSGWPTMDPADLAAAAAAPATTGTTGPPPFDPRTAPRIHWNDPKARFTARTGQDNYVALHESSAVVIHDINNDGDADDSFPGDLYEVGRPNVPGYRLYLNNILYGAVSVSGKRKTKLNLGAVNPGRLDLGEASGGFGYLDAAGRGNSLREILQYGYVSREGLPIGKVIDTAPGVFAEQIGKAMEFNFRDTRGEVDAIPWHLSDLGRKAGPTQIKMVPVVERYDDPTKSFYHGFEPLKIRIIGYAKFFVIDTSIDDATLTDDPSDANYMGGPPLEGELRGYFLGWAVKPDGVD